jgi:hypothetical protein
VRDAQPVWHPVQDSVRNASPRDPQSLANCSPAPSDVVHAHGGPSAERASRRRSATSSFAATAPALASTDWPVRDGPVVSPDRCRCAPLGAKHPPGLTPSCVRALAFPDTMGWVTNASPIVAVTVPATGPRLRQSFSRRDPFAAASATRSTASARSDSWRRHSSARLGPTIAE